MNTPLITRQQLEIINRRTLKYPLQIAEKDYFLAIVMQIISSSKWGKKLVFKGGTAINHCYLEQYRFSVDLDFDLLDESKEDDVFEGVIKLAEKHGTLKEAHKKRFSLFCLISYDDKARNIKVEINRRSFGSRYEIKSYLGISMQVMVLEDMFAHKLVAMHERIGETSRDVYDVWFFLQNRFPINKSIVESRSGMSFKECVEKCIDQLEKLDNKHILDGLGELITPNQKDRARVKLKEETIALLKLRT